eukprot:gene22704-27230_t
MDLVRPMDRGVITNFKEIETIWNSVFEKLKVDPKENHVIISDGPLNTKRHREKIAETMFETFGVSGLYIENKSHLALYASGRRTGLVVDSGEGTTTVVPIVMDHIVQQSCISMDVGGSHLTEYLAELLAPVHQFSTPSELECVRRIKELHASVPLEYPETTKHHIYRMPDGQVLNLSDEPSNCTQILFEPSIIGQSGQGLHRNIQSSIINIDKQDIRQQLFANIVLTGGTSKIPGFQERLLKELESLVPQHPKIHIYAPLDGDLSTWIGASLMASQTEFPQKLITRCHYGEYGHGIIH